MRAVVFVLALLAPVCTFAQEVFGAPWQEPQPVRIASVSMDLNRDTFQFSIRGLQTLDWPEPIPETPAEEIEQALTAGRTWTDDDMPWARRFVVARALDAEGKVLHQQLITVDFMPGCSGPGRSPNDPPPPPPQRWSVAEFNVKFPLAGVDSLEVQGWVPGNMNRWTLEEIRSDPAVRIWDVVDEK